MAQAQADEQPVFQSGAQLPFAFPEGFAEGGHALELGNFTGVGAILQLIVAGQFQGSFGVGVQRKRHGGKLAEPAPRRQGIVISGFRLHEPDVKTTMRLLAALIPGLRGAA